MAQGYTPVAGDKQRRVRDPQGNIISRRQYQKAMHGGLAPEKVAQARFNSGARGRGISLYNEDAAKYARKHGLTTAEAKKTAEFKILHAQFRRELQKKNPDKNYLNQLAKDLGKKGEEDYSDFGKTPELT